LIPPVNVLRVRKVFAAIAGMGLSFGLNRKGPIE
jgi:hypothetical protein